VCTSASCQGITVRVVNVEILENYWTDVSKFSKNRLLETRAVTKIQTWATLVQDLTCKQSNLWTWMIWMGTLLTACKFLIFIFLKWLDLKYKHTNPFNQWWRLDFLFLFWWFIFTLWAQNQVLSFLECEIFYGKNELETPQVPLRICFETCFWKNAIMWI
jgi:hypothetical protein